MLKVKNLAIKISHPGGSFFPVRDVGFSVEAGKTFAIVGESGSGKTMTALALLDLLPSAAQVVGGDVFWKGQKIMGDGKSQLNKLRGKHIAMIFQNAVSALNPVFRVGTQIRDIIRTHLPLGRKAAKQKAIALFEQVGLNRPAQIFSAYPHQLSGGMAQRVMIAIALSCHAELIIADEPTTALDKTTQVQILRLLKRLQQEQQFALMLISHDIGWVSAMANTVAVMKSGVFVEQGPADKILRNPAHSYTQMLLDSVVSLPELGSKTKLVGEGSDA